MLMRVASVCNVVHVFVGIVKILHKDEDLDCVKCLSFLPCRVCALYDLNNCGSAGTCSDVYSVWCVVVLLCFYAFLR